MALTVPANVTSMAKNKSEMVTELGVPLDWVPVTLSDTVVYNPPLRAIRCKTGGTLAVVTGAAVVRSMDFADGETREGKFYMVGSTGSSGVATIEGAV